MKANLSRMWRSGIALLLTFCMVAGMIPTAAFATEANADTLDAFKGKRVSIIGDSISTFGGVSNNTSYNSTIGNNAVCYQGDGSTYGIRLHDTWWQQAIDAMGMELCVNNSWSGSRVWASGASAGYNTRCVNLHNNQGENPDFIWAYLGTNDYSGNKQNWGTAADIDEAALFVADENGQYSYPEPTTVCEAYAIMLHKSMIRYPDAEIYCLGLIHRNYVDADLTKANKELEAVAAMLGLPFVELETLTEMGEDFKLSMGDSLHPKHEGMDRIAQRLINAMLGNENHQELAAYDITYDLTDVVSSNSSMLAIEGSTFEAALMVTQGNTVKAKIMMGDTDVTEACYKNGKIVIPNVTGDITITAFAQETSVKKVVSLGDSMTNGLALGGGYDSTGHQGFMEIDKYSYPALLAEHYDWELTQLATSCVRAEDLHFILEVGRENACPPDHWTYDELFIPERWYLGVEKTAEVFQTAVSEADVITLAAGNCDIGVYLMDMTVTALGMSGYGYDYSYATFENALELVGADGQVKELITGIRDELMAYLGDGIPSELVETLVDRMTYVVANLVVHYAGVMDRIVELNPDAEVIVVGLMNTLSGFEMDIVSQGVTTHIDTAKILDILLDPLNVYLAALPAAKQATAAYQQAKIYYAELDRIETLAHSYKDEYYANEAFYLSRFVPEIAAMMGMPWLSADMVLAYRYTLRACGGDKEAADAAFIAALGLDQETGMGLIMAIEAYNMIEAAILDSVNQIPTIDLDGNSEDGMTSAMLSLYARLALGGGMSAHPSKNAHRDMYEAIVATYEGDHTAMEETRDNLEVVAEYAADLIAEYYDDAFSYAYEYARENGYIEEVAAVIADVIAALEELGAVVESEIADLTALLEALEQEVAEKKAELENAVGQLKEELTAAVAELTYRIARVKAAIAEMKAALTELRETLESLDKVLETMAAEGIYAGIEYAQTTLGRAAQALEKLVAAVSEQASAKLTQAIAKVKDLLNNVYFDAQSGGYTITENSHYVALGDSTAAGESYVNLLAQELDQIFEGDYTFTNLAQNGLMMQNVAAILEKNAEEIAKADLVTVGFGSTGFTNFMVEQVMKLTRGEAVEFDWLELVGEEGLSYVEDAKAELYSLLVENGVEGEVLGVNLTDLLAVAVEAYAYGFVSYTVNLPEVENAIHELNPEALVVVVGMHNPLADVALTMNGEELAIGEYLQYLVDAANVAAQGYAMLSGDMVYVDAPAVEVANTKTEMNIMQFISEFVYYKGANLTPNAIGHAYIAEQILNALIVSVEEEEEQGLWGDVNGDGKINHNDARLVMQYYVSMGAANDGLDLTVADVNGDGKVNHNDARLILQFYVGAIKSFPVAQ